MKYLISLFCVLLPALLAGCASPGPKLSRRDRAVFHAFQRASRRAEAAASNSLVLFRVDQAASSQPQSGRERRPSTISFTGVVLSAEGHLLAPFVIRPDTSDRIEVWIGEQSYLARPIRADEQIGMTILKVEPRQPLEPIDLHNVTDLEIGDFGFVVLPADEDNGFNRFTFKVFCQGILEGRYR